MEACHRGVPLGGWAKRSPTRSIGFAKRRLFDMLRNRAGGRLSVSKLEQLDMEDPRP